MRILVTRPIEDAHHIAVEVEKLGHRAIVAPLMNVHYCDQKALQLDDVQAILITSANGVRAFARHSARRDLPVFAVGPQSAHEARLLGFGDVRSADGSAAELAAAVSSWTSPKAGALLHVSSLEAEGRLAAALTAKAFVVHRAELYEVRAVSKLPIAAHEALVGGTLDAVLLFSPRSAGIFSALVDTSTLRPLVEKLMAVCISKKTANALNSLVLREIRIAATPNQPSLLACLDT